MELDTITATGDNNFLYGDSDSEMILNSQGGADTITSTGDSNTLAGDSSLLWIIPKVEMIE